MGSCIFSFEKYKINLLSGLKFSSNYGSKIIYSNAFSFTPLSILMILCVGDLQKVIYEGKSIVIVISYLKVYLNVSKFINCLKDLNAFMESGSNLYLGCTTYSSSNFQNSLTQISNGCMYW